MPEWLELRRVLLGETLEGEMLESEGTGLLTGLTVRVTAEEVPPPGAGLETVMDRLAPAVKSDAGIDAVNCVAFTNAVAQIGRASCRERVEREWLAV